MRFRRPLVVQATGPGDSAERSEGRRMLTIDELVNSAAAGRIGRREFVKRALLAGVSAPAALALLEACSQGNQGGTGGPVPLDLLGRAYGGGTIQDNIKN